MHILVKFSQDQTDEIAKAKEDKTCVVEHAIKYKAKKDRKTGEIVEETWVTTITKKFVI